MSEDLLEIRMVTRTLKTPIGNLYPFIRQNKLHGLSWNLNQKFVEEPLVTEAENKIFSEVEKQVFEYFDGQRKTFELPLTLTGTLFQQKVWSALCQIPYGETCSYRDLAKMVDIPGAARAVGQANRVNPFAVVIPCHRVIGANGHLTGYLGANDHGMKIKRYLLELEQTKRFS